MMDLNFVKKKNDSFGFWRWEVTLSMWQTEHKRATKKIDLNNIIAKHHLKTSHPFDCDCATCLT